MLVYYRICWTRWGVDAFNRRVQQAMRDGYQLEQKSETSVWPRVLLCAVLRRPANQMVVNSDGVGTNLAKSPG